MSGGIRVITDDHNTDLTSQIMLRYLQDNGELGGRKVEVTGKSSDAADDAFSQLRDKKHVGFFGRLVDNDTDALAASFIEVYNRKHGGAMLSSSNKEQLLEAQNDAYRDMLKQMYAEGKSPKLSAGPSSFGAGLQTGLRTGVAFLNPFDWKNPFSEIEKREQFETQIALRYMQDHGGLDIKEQSTGSKVLSFVKTVINHPINTVQRFSSKMTGGSDLVVPSGDSDNATDVAFDSLKDASGTSGMFTGDAKGRKAVREYFIARYNDVHKNDPNFVALDFNNNDQYRKALDEAYSEQVKNELAPPPVPKAPPQLKVTELGTDAGKQYDRDATVAELDAMWRVVGDRDANGQLTERPKMFPTEQRNLIKKFQDYVYKDNPDTIADPLTGDSVKTALYLRDDGVMSVHTRRLLALYDIDGFGKLWNSAEYGNGPAAPAESPSAPESLNARVSAPARGPLPQADKTVLMAEVLLKEAGYDKNFSYHDDKGYGGFDGVMGSRVRGDLADFKRDYNAQNPNAPLTGEGLDNATLKALMAQHVAMAKARGEQFDPADATALSKSIEAVKAQLDGTAATGSAQTNSASERDKLLAVEQRILSNGSATQDEVRTAKAVKEALEKNLVTAAQIHEALMNHQQPAIQVEQASVAQLAQSNRTNPALAKS